MRTKKTEFWAQILRMSALPGVDKLWKISTGNRSENREWEEHIQTTISRVLTYLCDMTNTALKRRSHHSWGVKSLAVWNFSVLSTWTQPENHDGGRSFYSDFIVNFIYKFIITIILSITKVFDHFRDWRNSVKWPNRVQVCIFFYIGFCKMCFQNSSKSAKW